ncbi:hypothetical protein H8356DRAFT_1624040 [Neocallimastix lanati (nom. inval.)]|uniref:Uncharacterized protein n=1 Tax=Neocallimastix californiae TaxID=1754190 RepID=A0A1Y2E7M9_9FUNG|nr:hypothetical protein H8356DRAFT_1624040 [Neocallimastix sp. JGI-2020a]ORY66865.1 hypothetical protein LY90DRAFT_218991 [Neocallimastix californiae]|eukprot:ORY66865.1 hypothetical protein LY90DRAFT_218991 [Neocallimastix californiae]
MKNMIANRKNSKKNKMNEKNEEGMPKLYEVAKNEISPLIERYLASHTTEEIFNEVLKVINNRLYLFTGFAFSTSPKNGLEDNYILTKLIYELCSLPDKFFDCQDIFLFCVKAYHRDSIILLLSIYDVISKDFTKESGSVTTNYNEKALQQAIRSNEEHFEDRILNDFSKTTFNVDYNNENGK